MKRSILGCLLLAILFATGAQAQTAFTAQSGLWSDPATWGGALPDPGDNVFILSTHTVTIQSDRTVPNAISILTGGALVIGPDATVTATGNSGTTKITVQSGGTLTQYGDLVVDAGGIGNVNDVLVNVNLGGTWNVQGVGPVGQRDFVNGIDFDDNPTGSNDLTFRINAYSLPPGASHIRVTQGGIVNSIWPISAFDSATRKLTIEHALVQGYDANFYAIDGISGADSLSIIDLTIEPDEFWWIGSTIIQQDFEEEAVGRVEAIFNNATASMTAVYIDDSGTGWQATGGSDHVIFTWGFKSGVEFEFLDLALVRGGPALMDDTYHRLPVDPVSPPAPEASNGQADANYCIINGGWDVDYAAFVWFANSGACFNSTGNPSTMPDWTLDDVAFFQIQGQNVMNYEDEGDGWVYVDQMWTYDMRGVINGDSGHFARLDGLNNLAGITITNSGFLYGLDDLVYAFNGGTQIVQDCWVGPVANGNLIDIGDSGTHYITAERNEVWGMGETPLNLVAPEAVTIGGMTINDNLFVRCGNAIGRSIVDDNELAGATANTLGAISIGGEWPGPYTMSNTEVRWSLFGAMSFGMSDDGGNPIYTFTVDGARFENCVAIKDNDVGAPVPAGGNLWVLPAGTYSLYGYVIEVTGQSNIQLNDIVIIDSYRRGWDLTTSGMSTNHSSGIIVRGSSNVGDGGTAGCILNINGLWFEMPNSKLRGTLTNNGIGMPVHMNNPAFIGGGLFQNLHMRDAPAQLYMTSGNSSLNLDVRNSSFIIPATPANVDGLYIPGTAPGGHSFTGCTFVYTGNGRYPMRVPVAHTFTNCTFEMREGGPFQYALYYNSAAIASASSATNCIVYGFTGGSPSPISIQGVGTATIATMESTYNWSGTITDAAGRYIQNGFSFGQ